MNTLYTRYPELEAIKDSIENAVSALIDTYRSGGKILVCGNGGSCADCDHITGELMKGFLNERKLTKEETEKIKALYPEIDTACLQRAIPCISLPAQAAVISAFANDVNPEMVYAQLTFGYGKKGDALIGISTSGNSKNVVNALKVAKANGLKTIGLTGMHGGAFNEICDIVIKAPETETFKIQEYHLPVYHYICAKLEEELVKENSEK